MKRFRSILAVWKRQKGGSRRLLIVNRSSNTQDGFYQADNPLPQTTLNANEDQPFQNARESPLAEAEEDGSCFIMRPEANSEPQDLEQIDVCLLQRSVSQHFPKPPTDLHQNLQKYLLNVQETVRNEIMRPGPMLEKPGLRLGFMIECYHRQIFDHLNDFVEKIPSSQNCLVLIKWVLHTYLSQDLLCHPNLQVMDPIKKVDLLLLTDWVAKAKDKLLEIVQKEVRASLEKILQIERSQEDCYNEEACVGLYVDTIQCIEAIPEEAQQISPKLSSDIREICFKELLTFLGRYTTEQTEFLGKKAKMEEQETIHFFKTLKVCKELKQHVQTKSKGITSSLLQETVATLDNLEAFTLKLLMEILSKTAESHLKNYFKTHEEHFFHIIAGKMHFSKLLWCQDVQKEVMDEAYKLIAHIYLKHLVQSSQSNLIKFWSPNVGQKVAEDAKLLHNAISELAPGVQQWNLMLLKITDLLECKSTDGLKVTVAFMQKECLTWSQDADLLPALLRWKGLSRWQVLEVLDAIPGQQSRPRSVFWYSYITCM